MLLASETVLASSSLRTSSGLFLSPNTSCGGGIRVGVGRQGIPAALSENGWGGGGGLGGKSPNGDEAAAAAKNG